MSSLLDTYYGCGHCKSRFATQFDVCPGCGATWEKDGETIEPLISKDNVNHPSHYTAYKGVEVIDLTEQMNFNRGNAVKYIARAGLKSPQTELEDLKKARWYVDREIKRLGGE